MQDEAPVLHSSRHWVCLRRLPRRRGGNTKALKINVLAPFDILIANMLISAQWN
jgi:hypothetical protein